MKELSASQRLHNLCDWLEKQKHDSPYSAEAWDELQAENDRLRIELVQITKIHEQAISEFYDLKERFTKLEKDLN